MSKQNKPSNNQQNGNDFIADVSNSKADKREQAYQKFFKDHPDFRGKSIRYRGNYIFHKDEAYESIDYYLQTGIEP